MRPVPTAPRAGSWAVETRWRGPRCVVVSSGGVVDVLADGHFPVTDRFPEIRPIGRALGYTEAALDGVLVAPAGATDRLHRRLSAGSDSTRAGPDIPMAFMAVDLLWPRTVIRSRASRGTAPPPLRTSASPVRPGPRPRRPRRQPRWWRRRLAPLAEVVLKRVGAPYDPGAYPPDWRIVATGGG